MLLLSLATNVNEQGLMCVDDFKVTLMKRKRASMSVNVIALSGARFHLKSHVNRIEARFDSIQSHVNRIEST